MNLLTLRKVPNEKQTHCAGLTRMILWMTSGSEHLSTNFFIRSLSLKGSSPCSSSELQDSSVAARCCRPCGPRSSSSSSSHPLAPPQDGSLKRGPR